MKEKYFAWLETLKSDYPLESKEQFESRVNAYIWNSIPEYGEMWTSNGLKDKVEWNGKLKSFYGNTIVFPLEEKAISYVEEIQRRLYQCSGELLAEPLDKENFHITLHDLVNGTDSIAIANRMMMKGFAASSILEQLKKLHLPVIRMESTCVFNMASIEI